MQYDFKKLKAELKAGQLEHYARPVLIEIISDLVNELRGKDSEIEQIKHLYRIQDKELERLRKQNGILAKRIKDINTSLKMTGKLSAMIELNLWTLAEAEKVGKE